MLSTIFPAVNNVFFFFPFGLCLVQSEVVYENETQERGHAHTRHPRRSTIQPNPIYQSLDPNTILPHADYQRLNPNTTQTDAV